MKMQYDGSLYFRLMFMNITLIMFHKQIHEIPYDPTKNYKSYTNVLQIMIKLIHVTTSTN